MVLTITFRFDHLFIEMRKSCAKGAMNLRSCGSPLVHLSSKPVRNSETIHWHVFAAMRLNCVKIINHARVNENARVIMSIFMVRYLLLIQIKPVLASVRMERATIYGLSKKLV